MASTINFLFPCKKLRRSQRLEIREKVETQSKTINDGPLGLFEILPLELKFLVFTYLSVEDLSMLTISSKSMRNTVELYKNSMWSEQYLLPHPLKHSSVLTIGVQTEHYRTFERLGLLMKRSTCLYTTKDRLKLVQQFLNKYLCSLQKECKDPMKCISLICYGKFLHTVIAGWDDKECSRTFDSLSQHTLMIRNLNSVVRCKPGAYPSVELHSRLFFRRVFLDQCRSKADKALWLSHILKSFPMVQQARILFLLYGPMYGEEIQWYEMCESTPVNKDHAQLCFGDLASAFNLLHFNSSDWTEDATISVLDEITSTPDEWLAENIANLLFLSGDCITLKVLSSKAINGRVHELASIIASLCLVCWRQGQPLSWVVCVVRGVCRVMEHLRDKIAFLHCIVDTFKEVVQDLHEFGDTEDDGSQDFQTMLDAQAVFTKEIILLAFEGVLKP